MKKKVFIAVHNGMVGSAILRRLRLDKDVEIITKSRQELDLVSKPQVETFFDEHDIDQVYLAAGLVGGIVANNTYPKDFLYVNINIVSNIIEASHQNDVQDILFLGSSCLYPRLANKPMIEDQLLTGHLEPTNEAYAIAKIAGIKLCESYNKQFGRNYRSVIPTNLYGPNDNYHPKDSHVLAALIRKFHEGKINNSETVTIWGTGDPKREFLYVDDLADACVYIMNLDQEIYNANIDPSCSHINIGTGKDCSILELSELISDVIDYKGDIITDTSKPDGMPKKLLDVSLLAKLGWEYKTNIREGLEKTYEWFLENQDSLRSKENFSSSKIT